MQVIITIYYYVHSVSLKLCDVFEIFKDTCLKTYDLDPPHFYFAPLLAWVAVLKMSKLELEF